MFVNDILRTKSHMCKYSSERRAGVRGGGGACCGGCRDGGSNRWSERVGGRSFILPLHLKFRQESEEITTYGPQVATAIPTTFVRRALVASKVLELSVSL